MLSAINPSRLQVVTKLLRKLETAQFPINKIILFPLENWNTSTFEGLQSQKKLICKLFAPIVISVKKKKKKAEKWMTVIKYFYIKRPTMTSRNIFYCLPLKIQKIKKNQINKAEKILLDNFYPKSYRSHRIWFHHILCPRGLHRVASNVVVMMDPFGRFEE